jgi:thiosulfate dehydrogenase
MKFLQTPSLFLLVLLLLVVWSRKRTPASQTAINLVLQPAAAPWQPPYEKTIPSGETGALIRYGRQLIVHTAEYLGPKGRVAQISNGLNCQNCHLDAGTRNYGNPFSAVASTYPKFRPRSGRIESIEFRINDCLMRSLNGRMPLDSQSYEMRAMVAYLKWVGSNVQRGVKPPGSGIEPLRFMTRAADTIKGKVIYLQKCQSCHGVDGQGKLVPDSGSYVNPPLWGTHSYNTGAGLYRLFQLATYVKHNMPFGATFSNPQLHTDEAWDVAAYINSQPRPVKEVPADWPDLSKKPVDYPFGPYTDTFSETHHKYGPYAVMLKQAQKR